MASSMLFSLVGQMLWWSSPAQAQGFFQQLFGLSPPPQARSVARPAPLRQPLGGEPMRIESPRWIATTPASPRSVAREGSGSYTTMCVRMCDGFYFPISHRVPRSRFYHDADACRSRCGTAESRLFYYPSSGGSMKGAVDLTGRSYDRLPVAFLHRKKVVAGCGCRPEPWSVEAQVRHEGYAIAEGRMSPGSSRGIGTVTVLAGNYPDGPASAAPSAAAASAADGPSGPPDGLRSDPPVDTNPASAEPTRATAADAPTVRTYKPSSGARQKARAGAPRPMTARSTAATSPSRPKPSRVAAAAPSSKLVWPGDAPVRTR